MSEQNETKNNAIRHCIEINHNTDNSSFNQNINGNENIILRMEYGVENKRIIPSDNNKIKLNNIEFNLSTQNNYIDYVSNIMKGIITRDNIVNNEGNNKLIDFLIINNIYINYKKNDDQSFDKNIVYLIATQALPAFQKNRNTYDRYIKDRPIYIGLVFDNDIVEDYIYNDIKTNKQNFTRNITRAIIELILMDIKDFKNAEDRNKIINDFFGNYIKGFVLAIDIKILNNNIIDGLNKFVDMIKLFLPKQEIILKIIFNNDDNFDNNNIDIITYLISSAKKKYSKFIFKINNLIDVLDKDILNKNIFEQANNNEYTIYLDVDAKNSTYNNEDNINKIIKNVKKKNNIFLNFTGCHTIRDYVNLKNTIRYIKDNKIEKSNDSNKNKQKLYKHIPIKFNSVYISSFSINDLEKYNNNDLDKFNDIIDTFNKLFPVEYYKVIVLPFNIKDSVAPYELVINDNTNRLVSFTQIIQMTKLYIDCKENRITIENKNLYKQNKLLNFLNDRIFIVSFDNRIKTEFVSASKYVASYDATRVYCVDILEKILIDPISKQIDNDKQVTNKYATNKQKNNTKYINENKQKNNGVDILSRKILSYVVSGFDFLHYNFYDDNDTNYDIYRVFLYFTLYYNEYKKKTFIEFDLDKINLKNSEVFYVDSTEQAFYVDKYLVHGKDD